MKKGGTTFISRPFIPTEFGVEGRFFFIQLEGGSNEEFYI